MCCVIIQSCINRVRSKLIVQSFQFEMEDDSAIFVLQVFGMAAIQLVILHWATELNKKVYNAEKGWGLPWCYAGA